MGAKNYNLVLEVSFYFFVCFNSCIEGGEIKLLKKWQGERENVRWLSIFQQ